MKFKGSVPYDNPILMVYDKSTMETWIASLRGLEVVIEITKVKIRKTKEQNSGLHVLLTHFMELLNADTGNDLSLVDIKNIVKTARNFIVDVHDQKTGKFLGQKFRSFAELDFAETSNWIEWIYAYSATEFNITLPPLEKIE